MFILGQCVTPGTSQFERRRHKGLFRAAVSRGKVESYNRIVQGRLKQAQYLELTTEHIKVSSAHWFNQFVYLRLGTSTKLFFPITYRTEVSYHFYTKTIETIFFPLLIKLQSKCTYLFSTHHNFVLHISDSVVQLLLFV